jgi:hypothetical protein
MPWRPLSKSDVRSPRLDEPHEGLPPHLEGPVLEWVERNFTNPGAVYGSVETDAAALLHLQLAFRLELPLDNLRNKPRMALVDLLERMRSDDEFALDVVDYALFHLDRLAYPHRRQQDEAVSLNALLHAGGSAWGVFHVGDASRGDGDGAYRLTRRAVGPVREAITALPSSRAHKHLVSAWNRVAGRDPEPSTAYREAIRAVESVAKPIVLPDDRLATLGKMIRAMEDKPEKWTVTLGTADDVRRLMQTLWTGQLDRHGTDDENAPLNVSAEEADVAVHTALVLVRLFAGGHVQRLEPTS